MQNSTPRSTTVLYGTLAISTISAFGTGLHSIIKRKPNYGALSAGAAVNGGITAATFFGIREYAVSPIISKVVDADHTNKSYTLPSTLFELRTEKLLDSGLSGFVTGGMIRSLTSGLRVAFPAALTMGTACTGLQFLFNQLKISRLRYLSAPLTLSDDAEATPSTLPTSSPPASPTHTSFNESEPNWTTSLLKFIGVKPLADEEYLSKLRSQREAYLKRIAELESQIDDAKTRENGSD
ncbi:hypothetical protein E1B28_009008 [Marasmius oreades]|uniref:Uncharacterized protein n=1 Tax=Marasmius oreades TaxID=181124 RepID=A0A9P7UUV4_9AGAR|nr:uncharacterized protein E1B28_009008 [Marasmius oreades]KAG7092674.1 hypothetical protein E1B28_009008 [Marasmius oreades]